jgi:hypothetical protein
MTEALKYCEKYGAITVVQCLKIILPISVTMYITEWNDFLNYELKSFPGLQTPHHDTVEGHKGKSSMHSLLWL